MLGKTFFSIIIPTYNRGYLIAKTVEYVLAQTYPYLEIIIIDDGSTDNTEEVIGSIKDARIFYYKKENGERGAARNYGVFHAKGDYVNFFDSDDALYDSHLSLAEKNITRLNNPEIFYLNFDFRDESNKLLANPRGINGAISKELIRGNVLSCNGVFLRRDIALSFPFIEDRRLAGSEDWELWLRLSSHFPFHYSNEITSTMVNHDSRSVLNTDEDKLVLRKELALQFAFSDAKVNGAYGKHKNTMMAFNYTYIALHLALSSKKKRAIHYLLKGISFYPGVIFSRRFLAIVKHLL